MIRSKSAQSDASRRGFTVIELLVSMVVGLLLLTGVVQVLIVQGQGYRKQREVIDIRETYGFGAAAHVAIQVARHWGAEVYVMTRDARHRNRMREACYARPLWPLEDGRKHSRHR